ncbi:hypothetical protein CGZ80_19080 [Rhodopirellula sp. MGV]|nr:hypothetical protein CGZ80_19080 [Rhodopirellula sp. MGV]PNY35347.1 hypothetical protein C2E31_17630 [Rhodopirellula baltica]
MANLHKFQNGFLVLTLVSATAFLVGCGDSSSPEPTETDEIKQYLEDHPELKEPKPEVDNSVLTGE